MENKVRTSENEIKEGFVQNMANIKRKSSFKKKFKQQWPLHLMLFPCVILLLIFSYYPMAGIIIAFEKYNPRLGAWGSDMIGFDNFIYVFKMPNTYRVLFNTVYISFMKIVAGLIFPILFAVLLDLVKNSAFKRSIQTIIYIPYFLSWIIFAGILIDILSPSTGIVNSVIRSLGLKEVFFLGNPHTFPYTLVVTDVWKNFGYGTIIYLAAITSIDPALYEASTIDGANRLRQVLHVTLPGIMPIIVLMATLSLGNVLNAGFDQVLNLYNPGVYSSGDIIDTLVYRLGLQNNKYEIATAMGLFKSVVSFVFISVGYRMAYKYADYRVF